MIYRPEVSAEISGFLFWRGLCLWFIGWNESVSIFYTFVSIFLTSYGLVYLFMLLVCRLLWCLVCNLPFWEKDWREGFVLSY